MPSEVRHRVDPGQAFPLVRLTGVLDHDTAPEVRAALLDVLADQPEAVVVDVADLQPTRPEAVAVLRDLRRETADWPAARLALCDQHDSGHWQGTGWPVWSDSAEALGSFGSPDRGQRLSLGLEPLVGAARDAREMIKEACDRWDRAELAGSSCIVITEMVNNVVAHARTPMIVLLAVRGAGLSMAVRDESPIVPSFTGAPAPTSYGGRGILLVDSVADRWGNLVLPHGKVIWALVGTTAENGAGESSIGESSTGGSALLEIDNAGVVDPL